MAEEEAEKLVYNNLCREREVEEATSDSDLTAEADVPGTCILPWAAVAISYTVHSFKRQTPKSHRQARKPTVKLNR